MKYIYESHMGGLFCSDYEIEDTYCEQCGDSDWLMGCVSNAEEAWSLLKDKTSTFDSSKCENCPHDEDYEYCNEHCEDFAHSGGYNLSYVMQFICENFDFPKDIVYLVAKAKNHEEYIFVNYKVPGYEWGTANEVIYFYVAQKEYVNQVAREMLIAFDDPDYSTIKEIKSFKKGKDTIHIFEVLDNVNTDDEMWNQSAHYMDGGWYGYCNKADIKLSKAQEILKDFI